MEVVILLRMRRSQRILNWQECIMFKDLSFLRRLNWTMIQIIQNTTNWSYSV